MLHSTTISGGVKQVVFLHGLFGQGKNFTTIAKGITELASSTLVDLPNHGQSHWTDTFDYPAMADDVADLIQTLASPVTLVGHSMGGKVAMQVALRHPDLVERLVVVDISPVDGLASNFPALFDAMASLDLAHITSRSQADAAMATMVPDAMVRGFLLQSLQRTPQGWGWQLNLELLRRELDAISAWPSTDRSFAGPTLWIAGERSNYVRQEYRPIMRRLFPRVRLTTIKNSGHWVHSEQPEAFTSTLCALLDD